MEPIEWTQFGLRIALLLSWFVVIFKITNYIATDRVFSIAFWVYVIIHTAYVAVKSYKDYEEL